MIHSAIQTEVAARGFDYVTSARLTYFINRAYQEICEEEDWPFLETQSIGPPPLAISDLRTIESVTIPSLGVKLSPLDRRGVSDLEPSMSIQATPSTYYLTNGTVNVYPISTAYSLTVNYWKVPDDLSAAGDTPVLPTRFHQVIVDGACAFAYFDSDNFESATGMLEQMQRGIERMRQSLLVQQHDQPDDFIVASEWYDA